MSTRRSPPPIVGDAARRRRIPLRRRRAGPTGEALGRRRELPVPGLDRAAGAGEPRRAAALRPAPAAHARVRRPPFQEDPARLRPRLDAVRRGGWPTCAIAPASATASARLVAETFDVLSVTIWLLDEENDGSSWEPPRPRTAGGSSRRAIVGSGCASPLWMRCEPGRRPSTSKR